MKPEDDIEQSIRSLRRTTTAETDERILNDASAVLGEFVQPVVWRMIIKSPITRFIAAAVIIMAVLIGFGIFTGPGEERGGQVVKQPDTSGVKEVIETAEKPEPGSGVRPDAELEQTEQMFAAGDADGLVSMLSEGGRKTRFAAAIYLARIGDLRAAEALEKLSAEAGEDEMNELFVMAASQIRGRLEQERRGAEFAKGSPADRAGAAAPDKAEIEAEAKQIQEMFAAGDVEGLIEILSVGEFAGKVAAAEYLGEIGDERALGELERLNKEYGGWAAREAQHDSSGAFAWAICKILNSGSAEDEQIAAWFDLLEGSGPAVPEGIKERAARYNFDVGRRVAVELDKYDNPSIVSRLRQTENKGAASGAVWMEVREMDTDPAIAYCVEIARTEDGAQRYGAILCLGRLGDDAIDALDELAGEGHGEAIRVLSRYKGNPEVLKLICWHLTDNKNSLVRSMAVEQFYDGELYNQPEVVPALIEAMYDPNKYIRRNAARALSMAAYRRKTPHLEELEEAMLTALKHADKEVREYAAKALEHLGSERIGDEAAEPPAFRSDLEEQSVPPLTVQQKLAAEVGPLEKEAARLLKMGPAEEAVGKYEELLELAPGHQAYIEALEKAQAYEAAAAETMEKWEPDAPYIGVKGRYSYLIGREPEDVNGLGEEFDLALFLVESEGYEKALKLYEHIVEHYPENEYKVIRAAAAIGGLELSLYEDVSACVLRYIDIFAVGTEEVIDSTDERRNRPLAQEGGRTQAQLDFERFCKNDEMRERTIELCSAEASGELYVLLDEIIERCSQTDPKIVGMAEAAKAEIEQRQETEAEGENAIGGRE